MIIIGTAGHIDHGKSAIVKRLTGTDPDRLPEEKARGMTIDLGFAFRRTDDGTEIAFVDVPGHERFVKNMIAGAGGIDAVMLVVAADDGWMPQSEEHFQITRLLGVKHGLIVINKIDLVEPDWLELLEQDVRDKVSGSFLEDAPICMVSAQTGEGFDELASQLSNLTSSVAVRENIGKARLCVDRSFIRPGIGGVVTGTLRGGNLSVGQTVAVWPGQVTGKIRTLQSRNEETQTATPGQRTAVSLTGVDREHMTRGCVITDRTNLDYFVQNPTLALSVEILPDAKVALRNRRRVLLIAGTAEVEGEIRLFDGKEILPSEKGIVFFRPDEPVYGLVGDHCILRLPTPMVTLGGGIILDHLSQLPRRKDVDSLGYLKGRLPADISSLLLSELTKQILTTDKSLLHSADVGRSEIDVALKTAIAEGTVGRFGKNVYHRKSLVTATELITHEMTLYLGNKPHLKGLAIGTIKNLVPYSLTTLQALLDYMLDQGTLTKSGELVDIAGRGISLKGVIKEAYEHVISTLKAHPYDPPTLKQLATGGKVSQQAIKYIIDTGEGHKCGTDFLFLSEIWKEMVGFIRDTLEAKNKLSVPDLRGRFGLTRKYAIPIFEETDRCGITAREGDIRVKGPKYES
ncbi:MAG: selenocysteine-specific translation elongation factor [Candidatus Zixiibacteriota bacterium]|nr:MAG: selenocysteine-specific translation elongation factor [candidate division Zixibacteria bacterium]